MRNIDRVFAWILLLLGCMHGAVTFVVHKSLTIEAVWFFSGGLVLVLGALMNLVRIARPEDRMTAGVCLLANLLLFVVFVIVVPWILWHDLMQNPQAFVVGVAIALELAFAVRCFLSPG